MIMFSSTTHEYISGLCLVQESKLQVLQKMTTFWLVPPGAAIHLKRYAGHFCLLETLCQYFLQDRADLAELPQFPPG